MSSENLRQIQSLVANFLVSEDNDYEGLVASIAYMLYGYGVSNTELTRASERFVELVGEIDPSFELVADIQVEMLTFLVSDHLTYEKLYDSFRRLSFTTFEKVINFILSFIGLGLSGNNIGRKMVPYLDPDEISEAYLQVMGIDVELVDIYEEFAPGIAAALILVIAAKALGITSGAISDSDDVYDVDEPFESSDPYGGFLDEAQDLPDYDFEYNVVDPLGDQDESSDFFGGYFDEESEDEEENEEDEEGY